MADCQWPTPVPVAQINFLEWTGENHLRYTKFVTVREDEKAKDVVHWTLR